MSVKSFCLVSLAATTMIFTQPIYASAQEVGWQKMIDDGFHMEEKYYYNYGNCQKIDKDCDGPAVVQTPGRCGEENVTAEFYCAGPWRSYAGLWGIGKAYLFLSKYGANMPHIAPKDRKGWAVWQWKVETSGIYKVEVHYRPTDNRSPDADYYILTMKDLGEMDDHVVQNNKTIDQSPHGPLKSEGWVDFGNYEYKKGEVAAVGLWAQDDTHSDEADAVRWTLVEILPDAVNVPANSLLLK